MSLYCPLQIFMFFAVLISLQTTIPPYQPKMKLDFVSKHKELGENIQYKIELFTSNSLSLPNFCNYSGDPLNSTETEPFISQMNNITYLFPFYEPLNTSILCFKITPFKENGNCTFYEDLAEYKMYSLSQDGQGVNASNLYMYHVCSNWNLKTLNLKKKKTISGWDLVLQWKVNDTFKQCFQYYEIRLYQSLERAVECDPFNNTAFASLDSIERKDSYPGVFTNVSSGFYCMHICGKHETCVRLNYDPDWCKDFATNVVSINNTEIPVGESKPETNESRYWITLISGIGVVVVAMGLLGVSLCYYHFVKKRQVDRASISTTETDFMEYPNHNGEKTQYCKRKEVTFLYTQEVPEILEAILALAHFLRIYGFLVRIDVEDEANVRMNPVGWYSHGDIFIIIETDGAVYREQACIQNKNIYHVDTDFLDSYFIHSLMRIIDNSDSLVDYSKYLVVHFSFTPSHQHFQTFAQNKCFLIPQHLAQLCHFITYGKNMIPSTQNLLQFAKKWGGNENFEALNKAITKALKFVCKNPNYVKTLYREHSMSMDYDDDQMQML